MPVGINGASVTQVAQSPVAEAPPSVAFELRLRGGHSLHFESTIDPTVLSVLSVLIRAVDGA